MFIREISGIPATVFSWTTAGVNFQLNNSFITFYLSRHCKTPRFFHSRNTEYLLHVRHHSRAGTYVQKKDQFAISYDVPYYVFSLVLMVSHVFRTRLSQSWPLWLILESIQVSVLFWTPLGFCFAFGGRVLCYLKAFQTWFYSNWDNSPNVWEANSLIGQIGPKMLERMAVLSYLIHLVTGWCFACVRSRENVGCVSLNSYLKTTMCICAWIYIFKGVLFL